MSWWVAYMVLGALTILPCIDRRMGVGAQKQWAADVPFLGERSLFMAMTIILLVLVAIWPVILTMGFIKAYRK